MWHLTCRLHGPRCARRLSFLSRVTWAARDAYSVMGLDRSATPQEVKERFRTLAKLLGAHGALGEDGGGEHRFEGMCGRGKFFEHKVYQPLSGLLGESLELISVWLIKRTSQWSIKLWKPIAEGFSPHNLFAWCCTLNHPFLNTWKPTRTDLTSLNFCLPPRTWFRAEAIWNRLPKGNQEDPHLSEPMAKLESYDRHKFANKN